MLYSKNVEECSVTFIGKLLFSAALMVPKKLLRVWLVVQNGTACTLFMFAQCFLYIIKF